MEYYFLSSNESVNFFLDRVLLLQEARGLFSFEVYQIACCLVKGPVLKGRIQNKANFF